MHLREFHPEDAWAVAEIEALCNQTDPLALYYRRIQDQPHGSSDRAAQVSSCLRFQEMRRLLPGTVCEVLERPLPTDDEEERAGDCPRVVGFSLWTRKGTSPEAREWQAQNLRLANRIKAGLQYLKLAVFYPFDSALHHRHLARAHPILSAPLPRSIPPERWDLEALYIHPDHQQRGLGTRLLHRGLDRAQTEVVPVVARSTAKAHRLYEQAGFRDVVQLDFGALFAQPEDDPGMWVMLWEPPATATARPGA